MLSDACNANYLLNVKYFHYRGQCKQSCLCPPAGSISLFVMALLEFVVLETKLHRVNGLDGAGADIQVIMISFCACLEVHVCDIYLFFFS